MEMDAANKDIPPSTPDVWADGAAYEAYIGRWSRAVAREFLGWLAVAPGGHWLDIGCGTGALSQAILQHADPASLYGLDRAAAYVAVARQQVTDARAHFDTADARALPVESGAYDAVVSGLMLNFVPEPDQAVREMARAARTGGVVAAYVWDYAGGMQFLRYFWEAVAGLDPAARELDEGRRFPLCQPEPLSDHWRNASLQAVETRAIEVATVFRDFDDFWEPFLGGQGPAPTYVMSLSAEQRASLRERLRQTLPHAADGAIPLVARAWAVRGVR